MALPLYPGARAMTINKLAKWFLIIVAALVLLVGLILSPLSTPLIKMAANKYVPGLSIESLSGSVLSELSLENLQWQNEQWQVTVKQATVAHDWTCLLESAVCILNLNVMKPEVKQLEAAAPEEEAASESLEELSLPVSISLANAKINQFRFESPAATVGVKSLSTKANWTDSLTVGGLAIEGVTIDLPAAEEKPPTPTILSYQVPELPDVTIPLTAQINNLKVTNIKINQQQQQLVALDIALNEAKVKSSDISLTDLSLKTPQGQLSVSGEATLQDNYPLDITVKASAPVAESSINGILNATGNLSDLIISVNTDGFITVSLDARTNLLDETLPLAVNTTWPAQSLKPLAEVELEQGVLSIQGTMGEYAIQADGGATLPEIEQASFNIKALLNDRSLVISALDSALLNGHISNNGILYFSEGISWEGITRITDVDLKPVSEQAPSDVEGVIKAQMVLSDQGPNVLFSDIRLRGLHIEQPFEINGDAVYSANSDIMVANLSGKLAEDKFSAVVQLFEQQYIDALLAIDLPRLDRLYPQISGGINGTVGVKGDWAEPAVDAEITLTDVLASRALSEAATNQGPLNGDIELSGSLASHQLTADLALPEHTSKLTLNGEWQNGQWKGLLSDTQLALLNTIWELDSDVTLNFKQTPQSVTVSGHCWQSREDGQLCINALNYTPQLVKWDINADDLPVGLWATELLPDVIPERNSATLSIATSGQFKPENQQLTGSLNANITPDSWKLGTEKTVNISLDSFNVTGQFDSNQITLNSDISSPEVGEITTNIKIEPFAETPQIAGTINIVDWQLSPFKPLIANMNKLNGELNGDIQLDGPVANPLVNGLISLSNGTIDSDDIPVTVNQWQQRITLQGHRAAYEGEFMLGDGNGTLSGDVSWEEGLFVDLSIKGDAFTVNYDDSRVKVSPDLTASISPQKVEISGEVDIPWARIKINSLPPSAISPSKDVHLRGEPPSDALIDNINANVMVTIDDAKSKEVKIDAFGLTASLSGGIDVRTQPALTGYGDLQILNGRYEAYGQNLIIRTGEVQFNGPIDQPMLLVEAIRDPELTENDVIAGVRIEGPASQPSVSLFSEPSMDQAQNLAYLLNGSGSLGGGETDENAYAAMLIGFGLSSSESLTSNVGNALGIEDFAVTTTGQGDNTKLAISGKIAPNLTVRYGVGVFSDEDSGGQEVALRYQIFSDLYLEIVRSLNTAVDLYYQFTLGERGKEEDEKPESN